MRITYDKSVDAAYIYLNEPVKIAVTVPVGGDYRGPTCLGSHVVLVEGINLDFGIHGEVVGLEILEASYKLPQDLLDSAEQLVSDEILLQARMRF